MPLALTLWDASSVRVNQDTAAMDSSAKVSYPKWIAVIDIGNLEVICCSLYYNLSCLSRECDSLLFLRVHLHFVLLFSLSLLESNHRQRISAAVL